MVDFALKSKNLQGRQRLDFSLKIRNQGGQPPDPDFYRSIPGTWVSRVYALPVGVPVSRSGIYPRGAHSELGKGRVPSWVSLDPSTRLSPSTCSTHHDHHSTSHDGCSPHGSPRPSLYPMLNPASAFTTLTEIPTSLLKSRLLGPPRACAALLA
eukprot:6350898-Prymnesium_polylepis.1